VDTDPRDDHSGGRAAGSSGYHPDVSRHSLNRKFVARWDK
jgi:hypothetical protein